MLVPGATTELAVVHGGSVRSVMVFVPAAPVWPMPALIVEVAPDQAMRADAEAKGYAVVTCACAESALRAVVIEALAATGCVDPELVGSMARHG